MKGNNVINRIKNNFVNNNLLYICMIIVFAILVYCSINTIIINDDLNYSLLYGSSNRINNIFEVLKSQIADYFTISPRVIVHFIVEVLLIFGKNLWAILNPILILTNIYIINKIISLYKKKDNDKLLNFLFGTTCFMMLISYKWLIYWVAGSVNYVWTCTLLFEFIYLYLKYGYTKKSLINMGAIQIVSIMHESLFVFTCAFVILTLVYDVIINKKFDKKKLLLFIPLIISAIFLFMSPSTLGRMQMTSEYGNLSLIQKFNKSIPIVSLNLYNLKNMNNVIPLVFLISIIIGLFKCKGKYKYAFISINIINIILVFVFNNNWLYFTLSLIAIFSCLYINNKNKEDKLTIILIAYYAVAYSLCITTEYMDGRPNYHVHMYMILMSLIYIYDVLKSKRIINGVLMVVLALILIGDVYIYTQIGNVKRDRIISIEKYKTGESEKLYLKELNGKYLDYNMYQINANEPQTKEYYAYKYYLYYYGLPEDTIIEFIN